MKTKSKLSILLIVGMLAIGSSLCTVQAKEVSEEIRVNFVGKEALQNKMQPFYYENDDPDDIKNVNITTQEAIAAQEERTVGEVGLGYSPGIIHVYFDRKKAGEKVIELGLENETALYQKALKEYGDNDISEQMSSSDTMMVQISLNKNKTVSTAVKQYSALPYVTGVYPIKTTHEVEPFEPPSNFKPDGIYPVYNDDSISLGCVCPNASFYTKYRWEYCKIGTNEWKLLSDWSTSEWCTWYPDANEDYAVVCKVSYHGRGEITAQTVWYASRPQMKKRITGRCALPDKDGILFGCTSTVGKNDAGYLTTCYIWSFDQQSWITKSAYEASNCAWFRSSVLPKGTYMMYNCTERRLPDGTLRKLSCDYYVFTI